MRDRQRFPNDWTEEFRCIVSFAKLCGITFAGHDVDDLGFEHLGVYMVADLAW